MEQVHTVEDLADHLELFLNSGCYVRGEPNGERILVETRALVDHFRGLTIHIYPNEQPPPHFHVWAPGMCITFRISDCALLKDSADGKTLALITYWYRSARPKLIEIWNKTRPADCPVGPIENPAGEQ